MRPAFVGIPVLALATACSAAALAASRPANKSAAAPHSQITVTDCHPSDDIAQRFASFSGQMRSYAGTTRMAMRFTLLERLPGVSQFAPVSLPELRAWRKSKSGARAFIYTQRVTALRDGGSYRMRVQFRWYGAHGIVVHSNVAHSSSCRQPAPLPNLTITSITAGPATTPDQRTYSVTVANTGRGEARNVQVALRVDGNVAGSSTVDLLPGQESAVVQIAGPLCALTVRAVADPNRSIRETSDSDNSLTVPCAQAQR